MLGAAHDDRAHHLARLEFNVICNLLAPFLVSLRRDHVLPRY